MPEKRTATLNCRISQKLKDDLEDLYERYRVNTTAAVEDALEALIEYVAREGYYRRPMRMVSAEALITLAEDDPAAEAARRLREAALAVLQSTQPPIAPKKPPSEPRKDN